MPQRKAYPAHWAGLLICLLLPFLAKAQIAVDTTHTAVELVENVLLGNGVKVRNVYYRGAPQAIAWFRNGASEPDIKEGIVLSTGNVFDVPGPNDKHGNGRINSKRGDSQLRHIARGNTYDAAVLEFDFMANKDSISFFYFFASEEYNEYVNSEFNDVFAFFITGPGYGRSTNLATLPGSGHPITINSVNNGVNPNAFIDNNYWNDRGYVIKGRKEELNQVLLENFQFDGMTVVLRARARVVPGKVYHIKIGISDVSDGRYDSAVFLEANSFTSDPYDPDNDPHLRKRRERLGIVINDSVPSDPVPDTDPQENSLQTDTETDTDSGLPDEIDPNKILYRTVVEFDFDADNLSPEAIRELKKAVDFCRNKDSGYRQVTVWGHTDIVGSRSYNQRLSNRRADAVVEYFRGEGLRSSRIESEGFGFDRPVEDNQTAAGRARNRRVEVFIMGN